MNESISNHLVQSASELNCLQCGKMFVPKHGNQKKYCSVECTRQVSRSIPRKKRVCSVCGSEFQPANYHQKICCRSEGTTSNRVKDLFRNYGLTEEDYAVMLEQQHGVCAICGGLNREKGDTRKNLGVDHSHATGENRGLLCDRCNIVLGKVNDDASLLMRAVEYLRKFERP